MKNARTSMRRTVASILCGSLLLSGCASIVSKSDWPVAVRSDPDGANVTVRDSSGMEVQSGVTPMSLTLSAKSGFFCPAKYTFDFEKRGYNSSSVTTSADINPWYFGNLIFGGLIGLVIVDPATGAMWKMDDHVYGHLRSMNEREQ